MSLAETPTDVTTTDEFAERVFGAVLGAQQVQAVYLGHELGWYQALADHGEQSSVELAKHTSTAERYAREWLEHQAVCGYLTVERTDAAPTERRYTLPAAHAEVLVDADSLAYTAPLPRMMAALGRHIDRIADAYRTGAGVSWDDLGHAARQAQADANRPLLLHALGQELLPQVADIHVRLEAGARVADVGCGGGWSSIGIARAYPATTVDGYDVDPPSVEMARRHAESAGVADRVQFHTTDAANVNGRYDVVFAFECVHDMPDPVSVLSAMRRLAGDNGSVIIMDERVGEHFTGPGDEVEQLMYGYSLMCCLPDGMSHQPSVGTGTVMRPSTLAAYAQQAGFGRVDILPIENDFFRFYRLGA